MQAPERQPESEGQTFPHLPQLLSSMFPSMHVPLQRRLPAVHPHLPSLQNCSPGQLLPHLPQLLISKLTSTHLPPQSVSPCKHPHVPLKQESPGGQTFPHEPQSDSSDFKSVQCVPFLSGMKLNWVQRTNRLLFQNSIKSEQTKLYN